MTGKNNNDPCALHPYFDVSRKCFTLWKNIDSPLLATNKFFLQVSFNIDVTIRHEKSMLFWQNGWLNGLILKQAFPRIFTLAIIKNKVLHDYGSWVDLN